VRHTRRQPRRVVGSRLQLYEETQEEHNRKAKGKQGL
jgi:hypothetical protein